jgi:hypothetical protein
LQSLRNRSTLVEQSLQKRSKSAATCNEMYGNLLRDRWLIAA